jgi:uncharacterized membrane protein
VTLEPVTLMAILLMGVGTYACRGGGYWLFRQISPSPWIRRVLTYIPGTLFVSFVVPALLQGGLQPMVGGAATLAAMIATRNLLAGIVCGVGAAWIVWLVR